jgi:DNA-directed RNA polymerase subunit RPC12/RpoP
MACPNCASNQLMIRERTGWERIMALFTSLRKYRCRDCDHVFRAADRRRGFRDPNSPAATRQRARSASSSGSR